MKDTVAHWLSKYYSNFEQDRELPETGYEADFIVTTPLNTLVIEVAEEPLEGVGRALAAAMELDAVPVLVVSAKEDVDQIELVQQYFNTRFDNRHLRIVTINA